MANPKMNSKNKQSWFLELHFSDKLIKGTMTNYSKAEIKKDFSHTFNSTGIIENQEPANGR